MLLSINNKQTIHWEWGTMRMKHVMLNTLHSILETVLLIILSLSEDNLVMLEIQWQKMNLFNILSMEWNSLLKIKIMIDGVVIALFLWLELGGIMHATVPTSMVFTYNVKKIDFIHMHAWVAQPQRRNISYYLLPKPWVMRDETS